MLVARHDLSNLEALAYLEQRLREIGVIAALERAGFEPGDEVRIGDQEFELAPRLGRALRQAAAARAPRLTPPT